MYIFPTIALLGVFMVGSMINAPLATLGEELQNAEKARATVPVLLSSYNPVPEQTDGDPMTTASGLRSNPEVMAARSRDLADTLPFGTVIRVMPGEYDSPESCGYSKVSRQIGYRVITDTMHARKTQQVDIMLDQTDTVTLSGRERNPSVVLGLCDDVEIEVVGRLALKDIPDTQLQLKKMFDTEIPL
jgi:3D (Asp-Asp-Asp) domain-containing protein